MIKVIKSGIFLVAILMFFAFSCKNSNDKKFTTDEQSTQKSIYLIKFTAPSNGMLFSLGDNIDLTLKLHDEKSIPDSVVLFVNDKKIGKVSELTYKLKTNELGLGTLTIRATAYRAGLHQTASTSVKLKSNLTPKNYSYKVIKTFLHDPDAYTQGLFYKDGFLYEGTGQKGASSIRKVELETGKILQSINLEEKYFGEGITLFNNKIYQLTWTSEVGFVYDFTTFKQIRTFHYNTQGWGLTTNGKDLIMSDGSNNIYFMDPENFSEIKHVEVFDNKGAINELNELEYINGDIYANIYQTDFIVIIDPSTGMVKGRIDFKGLLKDSDRTNDVDVLNGIAWDEIGKRLYVTGKLWPKLYQVELVAK
ncbi:MAG: glutaminyl-peptide cyclotransferase [Bacteroidales bacterium]|nr:glutaminyl-peptide cyclotransferase [Bacteroidales bacterium]